ncbi:MAG TPA: TauD/TfdA family dioxygenase, partial [Steroidobacteraceae bacterium]|nr:TauD/TfdA family dioxygenase [Steroidobacteraceae bacterium]
MLAATVALDTARPISDLARFETERRIEAVEHELHALTIHWDDGRESRFHALWLRDNCPCSACRHPHALERTFVFVDHPEPCITAAVLGPEELVEVTFRAGEEVHRTCFARGWLRAHEAGERGSGTLGWRPKLWTKRLGRELIRIAYREYMETAAGVRGWIEALQRDGIVLLEGVPQEPGKVLEVARRIGPVRATNFGEYYDVQVTAKPNASADTDMGLELHTDLANWREPPDVQLLCCLKSSVQGGESVFADGFRVAERLRDIDPEAFGFLSTRRHAFRFHDQNCDIRTMAPVIEIGPGGAIERVRFNNWLRAATPMPFELVEPLYRALASFW